MEKTDPLISVQISDYAFDRQVLEAVHCNLDALDAAGIYRETVTMSTVVWGDLAASYF